MTARGILAGILWLGSAATSLLAAEHSVVRAQGSSVVEMRVAALIMSGQQGGALPIALAMLPGVVDPDSIITMVEIDGAALLDSLVEAGPTEVIPTDADSTEDSVIEDRRAAAIRSVAGSVKIELFAYVLGDQLDVLDQQSTSLEIDTTDHGEILAATGLKWFLPLALPPDTGDSPRQLRVLVRVGNTFGLRGVEVPTMSGVASEPGVAPGSGAVPKAWPPAFAELDESWLIAMPRDQDVVLPPPFGFGDGASLPTSRAVIVAGEPVKGQAFVVSAPDSRLIVLVRSPGEVAIAWPLDIDTSERAVLDGSSEPLPFKVAPFTAESIDLDPGLYEIALAWGPDSDELPEAADVLALSSYVPVFFTSPTRSEVSEPVMELPGRLPAAASKRRQPSNRKLKELLGRIATDYLSALRQLVAGERQAALVALSASETGVVEQLSSDAVPILAEAQASALASLEGSEWRIVLPAALLHLDLSRRYRRQHRFILTHHATQRVVNLANAIAARLATPEASADAASILASLGSQYQLTGSLSQAKRLFEQALNLADDPTALFGLATLQEKRGLFLEAVPVLERLVASQPELLEGRLRLALNRMRSGRVKLVRDDLRRLARQTDSNWVAVVAHQELARLEVERNDPRAAVKLLRRGLQRWPAHPTLAIQLAYILESQGQRRSSLELLTTTRFGSSTGAAADPTARERSRYNLWSEQLSTSNRRQLDTLAQARLGDLGRWLDTQPGVTASGATPSDATPAGVALAGATPADQGQPGVDG